MRCPVSPARAGMDLLGGPKMVPVERFPRTRGDGPNCGSLWGCWRVFPPHARGWTRAVTSASRSRLVSPARAGMDLRYDRCRRSFARFPRTRGDGPDDEKTLTWLLGFPPHARGWTVKPECAGLLGLVSPARAGMDPDGHLVHKSFLGFPRTRGDGPCDAYNHKATSWHCQVVEQLVDRPPRCWAPTRREPAMLGIKNGRQLQLDNTVCRSVRHASELPSTDRNELMESSWRTAPCRWRSGTHRVASPIRRAARGTAR